MENEDKIHSSSNDADGHDAHDDHGQHATASHDGVSRRTLLILGGVALAAAALPSAFFLAPPSGAPSGAPSVRRFLSLLADPEGAAHIGKLRFADGVGPAASLPVYEKRLSRSLLAHGWQGEDISDEAARDILTRAIKADYAENRLTIIRDWPLSQTETDLCALAALSIRDEAAHG